MKEDNLLNERPETTDSWLTRDRALTLVLVLMTLIAVYLCYLLVHPFLPALAWALALAVVARPSYDRMAKFIHSNNLAAFITVMLVALLIVAPTVVLTQQLVAQVGEGVRWINKEWAQVEQKLAADDFYEQHPKVEAVVHWFTKGNSPGQDINRVTDLITGQLSQFLSGSFWAMTQLFITLYILFYFMRDHREVVARLRSLVPLSESETDKVFDRVENTVYATLYGTVVVALVQGIVSWFIFFFLNQPAPLLWATLIAFLAIVPVLGPVVVFVPAVGFLLVQEDWPRAAGMTVGGIVVLAIGHFLYPFLVGQRLQLHPVLIFFSFLGGLAVFGAAGLILGPAVLAFTEALVNVWHRRTAEGGNAMRPSQV